ncbi:T-kininogen 1-like [Eleutherodactylus coqui]|uniref:T-kininogen 1-like n=1 Tax=Eleutherodactylus coqui TaxID=57060 RepID=UPI003462B1C7
MRLLSFLLLCSHCLLGSATVIDDNCNDENVFNAVDEALRTFNNAKEDGNLFILYKVTDSKIKVSNDGQSHHFIEYEIDEGSCEVKSGKSWQECSSTHEHRAKCSAHVLFNQELKIRNVESQNCSSLKAVEEPPVKAVQQLTDKENKELLCFVHSSIEQVNTDADHPFYFDLESIENATRQVMFGWIYHIQFHIQQTNCSRSSFTSKDSKECKIDKEGESFKCNVDVNVTPHRKVFYSSLECKSDIGVCIHCPIDIWSKGPELRKLLVQVMGEYNVNSNHTELYAVDMITRAIKKGFQRELYVVDFQIGPTNCSKTEYSILGPECVLTQYYDVRLICKTKIKVGNKTNIHSAPQCEEISMRVGAFAPGPGGLSPFRNRRNIKNEENDGNGMLKLFNPPKRTEQLSSKRHEHNKGNKHAKKEKNNRKKKNKHEHQDSSEEDNENEVTQAPLQLTKSTIQKPTVQTAPEGSRNQKNSPNTDETCVLDFPELPTDIVPRCPGNVWQPISDDDLPAAVDSTLPSDQNIEKNEPFTPKQITTVFFDDDLLGLN